MYAIRSYYVYWMNHHSVIAAMPSHRMRWRFLLPMTVVWHLREALCKGFGTRNGRSAISSMQDSGSPSWIRTNDQVINSHLLYR